MVVFLTFWARLVLAGWNSYWLDELYSVYQYVLSHDSVVSAISDLAATSIHPPLYQFLLYFWIQLFGDGEVVTRLLSNIYVSLAVVFIYLGTLRAFGWLVANAAALVSALCYSFMYYGLETRSYGQSLLLASVSSFVAISCMERLQGKTSPVGWFGRSWPWLLLAASGLGMLLTHYYNVFFWGAQGLFLAGYAVATAPVGKRMVRLALVGAFYLGQVGVYALVWGRVFLRSFERNVDQFTTESVTFTPLEMLRRITEDNFAFWGVSTSLALAGIAGLVAWALRDRWPNRASLDGRPFVSGTLYLSVVTAGTLLLAYGAFETIQQERFRPRYLVVLVPGLSVFLVVALRQLAEKLLRTVRRPSGILGEQHLPIYSAVLVIVVAVAVVMPGSFEAGTFVKDEWRGTAREIVAIVESNPDSSFVIYETSFRSTRMFNYYLERMSDDIRVSSTIRRAQERGDQEFAFERHLESLEQHDLLIVPFVHHPTSNFPRALARMEEMFPVQHRQIDETGRGLIIFDVSRIAGSGT